MYCRPCLPVKCSSASEVTGKGGYVGDGHILRLIRKRLKAGVTEDGALVPTEASTPQGAAKC